MAKSKIGKQLAGMMGEVVDRKAYVKHMKEKATGSRPSGPLPKRSKYGEIIKGDGGAVEDWRDGTPSQQHPHGAFKRLEGKTWRTYKKSPPNSFKKKTYSNGDTSYLNTSVGAKSNKRSKK